jgi:ethanolamine kinase
MTNDSSPTTTSIASEAETGQSNNAITSGSEESQVVLLDIEVRKPTLRNDIRTVYERLHPNEDMSKLVMNELTEGAVNCMFKCYLVDQSCDRAIIVRLFNFRMDTSAFSSEAESLQNRDLEFEGMCRASNLGICAKVFARFKNGIAYAYVPGNTLQLKQVHDIELGRKIAAQVARLHTLNLRNNRSEHPTQMLRMRHESMPAFERMFEVIQGKIDKSNIEEYKFLPKLREINDEITKIERRLEQIGLGEVAFCHNDLNLSNIIYNESSGEVKLLDFEWGEQNPILFDIAGHFGSFAGFFLQDYDNDLLPSEQFQRDWIHHYWSERHRLAGKQMDPVEFDELVEETLLKVIIFMQVVKLNFVIRAPIWDFRESSDPMSSKNKNNIALYCLKALTGFRSDKERVEQFLCQLEQKKNRSESEPIQSRTTIDSSSIQISDK